MKIKKRIDEDFEYIYFFKYAFDSKSYEQINVTPDENLYFDGNVYYMPKVTI